MNRDYKSLEFVFVFVSEMEILSSGISVGRAETQEVHIINSGTNIFSHGSRDHK